nr:protein APCDD1-like [Penaeus vannamei]
MGLSAVFLIACVSSWLAQLAQGHLGDNMVHDTGLPTCHAVLHQATHPPIAAPMPPDVRGKWVSTSCETRPGPQYVLRAYSFHRDGTFHLALHFYRDPHCAHPAHSLAAHGHLALGRPSWVTPGGTEAEYTLSRVEVVAHTHRDAAAGGPPPSTPPARARSRSRGNPTNPTPSWPTRRPETT